MHNLSLITLIHRRIIWSSRSPVQPISLGYLDPECDVETPVLGPGTPGECCELVAWWGRALLVVRLVTNWILEHLE